MSNDYLGRTKHNKTYIEILKLKRKLSIYRSEIDLAIAEFEENPDYVIPLIVLNRHQRYELMMEEMIKDLAFEVGVDRNEVEAYISHLEKKGLILSEKELKEYDNEIANELSILW